MLDCWLYSPMRECTIARSDPHSDYTFAVLIRRSYDLDGAQKGMANRLPYIILTSVGGCVSVDYRLGDLIRWWLKLHFVAPDQSFQIHTPTVGRSINSSQTPSTMGTPSILLADCSNPPPNSWQQRRLLQHLLLRVFLIQASPPV